MAKLLRRTDLGEREFLSRTQRRYIQQQIRDAGDGSGVGASATWGSISGTLSNQTDLNQVLKDRELFDFLMDD